MEMICGECPAEQMGCKIRFIKILKQICMCKKCLIKTMCNQICEDRESLFIELPDWIRQHLDEIQHFYEYNGIIEYNRLMKDLEKLVIEADLESVYEGW